MHGALFAESCPQSIAYFSFTLSVFFVEFGLTNDDLDASKRHLQSITLNAQEKDWLVAHPEITIAHTFNWPPYSFLDSNN